MPKHKLTPLMSSDRQCWETPPEFFHHLNQTHSFTLDAAATEANTLCDYFFTEEENSLEQEWCGRVWLNPPYGRSIGRWVEKCRSESESGRTDTVVALLPARTDTRWFHEHCRAANHIWFVQGRLRFRINGLEQGPAPFPSMVVTWSRQEKLPAFSWGGCNG